MFCSACGQSNRDGARFCKSCGAALGTPSPPPVPAPPVKAKKALAKASGVAAVAPAESERGEAGPAEARGVAAPVATALPGWVVATGAGVGAFFVSFIVCSVLAGAMITSPHQWPAELGDVPAALSPGRAGLALLYAGHGVPFAGTVVSEWGDSVRFSARPPALVSFMIPFIVLLAAGYLTSRLAVSIVHIELSAAHGAAVGIGYAATALMLAPAAHMTLDEGAVSPLRGVFGPNMPLVPVAAGLIGAVCGALGGAFEAILRDVRLRGPARARWHAWLYGGLAAFAVGMFVATTAAGVKGTISQDNDPYVSITTAPLVGGLGLCLGHGGAMRYEMRAEDEREWGSVSIFSQRRQGQRVGRHEAVDLPTVVYLTPLVVAFALMAGGALGAFVSGRPSAGTGAQIVVCYLPLLVLLRFGLSARASWTVMALGEDVTGTVRFGPDALGLFSGGAIMAVVFGALGGHLVGGATRRAARGQEAGGAETAGCDAPAERIETVPCSLCNQDIDRRLGTCPHCGATNFRRTPQ